MYYIDAILSGSSSLKSMYPPARIVSTTLPGIAGRADESTKGGVFNDVLTPVRGVASKVANEGVESTGSGDPSQEGEGDLFPLPARQRVGHSAKMSGPPLSWSLQRERDLQ